MNPRLTEAATRWQNGYPKYCTGNPAPGNPWLSGREELEDARMLADYGAADIVIREREAKERALPIDNDWLLSIGGEFIGGYNEVRFMNAYFVVAVTFYDKVTLSSTRSPQSIVIGDVKTTTRGMMLDFLAGLLIPTKAAR